MKPFDEIPSGAEGRSRALLEQANALFKEEGLRQVKSLSSG
jgi:hypothetical protein